MSTVHFDRDYWPKLDAEDERQLERLSAGGEESPFSVWVAESLVNEPPRFTFDLATLKTTCFIWSVGRDCVTAESEGLLELIEDDISEIGKVLISEPQIDECRETAVSLRTLAAWAIGKAAELDAKADAANPTMSYADVERAAARLAASSDQPGDEPE